LDQRPLDIFVREMNSYIENPGQFVEGDAPPLTTDGLEFVRQISGLYSLPPSEIRGYYLSGSCGCSTPPQEDFKLSVQHYFLGNDQHEYYVAINYPSNVSSVISVTGPYIYNWWVNPGHVVAYLSARPAVGYTYTIQARYGNGTIESKALSVTGLNDQFAVLISPADNSTIMTTTPTFTWQGASNSQRYMLGVAELIGSSENFLWWVNVSAGSNSLTYNGTPLKTGYAYRVYLHSFDVNGDQATTWSTFAVY